MKGLTDKFFGFNLKDGERVHLQWYQTWPKPVQNEKRNRWDMTLGPMSSDAEETSSTDRSEGSSVIDGDEIVVVDKSRLAVRNACDTFLSLKASDVERDHKGGRLEWFTWEGEGADGEEYDIAVGVEPNNQYLTFFAPIDMHFMFDENFLPTVSFNNEEDRPAPSWIPVEELWSHVATIAREFAPVDSDESSHGEESF